MEQGFSAPLHHKMNPEVQELVEQGYNVSKAYRMVAHAKAKNKVKQESTTNGKHLKENGYERTESLFM